MEGGGGVGIPIGLVGGFAGILLVAGSYSTQRCRGGLLLIGALRPPDELAVHLVGLSDIVRRRSETEEVQAHLPSYVDDVSAMPQGSDKAMVFKDAGRLASLAADHIQSVGTRLDLGGKEFALASEAVLLRQLKNQLGELGGSAVHSVGRGSLGWSKPCRIRA